MNCIVLNVTEAGDWIDQCAPHPRGMRALGLHVPPKFRPTLVHRTRQAAEQEAVRLACQADRPDQGEFAVFELVGVVRGVVLTSADQARGVGPAGTIVPRWLADPVDL